MACMSATGASSMRRTSSHNKQGTVGDETEVVFVPFEPSNESPLTQPSSAVWQADGEDKVVAHVRVACEHLGSPFDNVVAASKEVAEQLGWRVDGDYLVSVCCSKTGASHLAHLVLASTDELLMSPVLAANLRLDQQDECDAVLQVVPSQEARRAVAREVTIARISFVHKAVATALDCGSEN